MGGILLKGATWFAGGVTASSLVLTATQGLAVPATAFIAGMSAFLVLGTIGVVKSAGDMGKRDPSLNRAAAHLPTHSNPGARIATETGWQPVDGEPRRRGRSARALLALTCLILGLAAGFVLTVGGVERARVLADEVATTGRFQPLWKSELLDSEVAALNQEFAGRELTWVYMDNTQLVVSAVSPTDPDGLDTYKVVGGKAELNSQGPRSTDAAFGLNQVKVDAIRTAVAAVYADDPDAPIISVGFYRVSTAPLTLAITIDGTYDITTRHFDPATGEEITD